MGLSHAEVARTMAAGHLVGVIHLRGYPDRLRVRHATGPDGDPMLLALSAGEVAAALHSGDRSGTVVLTIDDVPPVLGAPCRGRLWMSGVVAALSGPAARSAALTYAEIAPCSDLLDVGAGYSLYRLRVSRLQLARGHRMIEIDLDDYLAASADPLHREEKALLAELAAYDGRRLRELYAALTGRRPPPGIRAVRIDRFGLVVTVPDRTRTLRRRRIDFPSPLAHGRQLMHLTSGQNLIP